MLGFGCMSRAWARLYNNVAQAICTTRAFWHSG